MDIKQIRRQALNENTLPEILAELAKSKDPLTKKNVSANPNTPIKVLEKLNREFPEEIASNPILDVLLLENPHHVLIQSSIARSSSTPIEKLVKLSSSNNLDVCEAVAQNLNTPLNVLNSLIVRLNNKPSKANVFCAIAKHPNATVDTLDRLIEVCNCYSVYYAVLENSLTTAKTLEKIATNKRLFPNHELYSLVTQHPNKTPTIVHLAGFYQGKKDTPHDVLEQLANHQNASIKDSVFRHPNVSDNLLHKLSSSPHANVAKAVAEHSKTANKTIYMLARDDSEEIRKMVASRQDIAEEIIDFLVRDNSEAVRCAIARNQNIAENIIKILARDSSEMVRCATACRQDITSKIIDLLARDSSKAVRYKISCRQDITPKIIDLLAQDSDESVRCAIAENKDIPEYIAIMLAYDSSARVRCQLVSKYSLHRNSKYSRRKQRANFSAYILNILLERSYENTCIELPHDVGLKSSLEKLQQDYQDYPTAIYNLKTREYIASHPQATREILNRLKSDRCDIVRKAVAKQKDLLEEIANFLAKDSSEYVRYELSLNHSISAATLQILLNSCRDDKLAQLPTNTRLTANSIRRFGSDVYELIIKQKIARHSQATQEMLDYLKSDRYDCVREAVASNPKVSDKALEQLKNDKSIIVRIAVANNPNTSLDVLEELSTSTDKIIARQAKSNLVETQKAIQQAQSKHTAPEMLTKLASNRSKIVRKYVASNANTPMETLEILFEEFPEETIANPIFVLDLKN